jgi:hypothetical protein
LLALTFELTCGDLCSGQGAPAAAQRHASRNEERQQRHTASVRWQQQQQQQSPCVACRYCCQSYCGRASRSLAHQYRALVLC